MQRIAAHCDPGADVAVPRGAQPANTAIARRQAVRDRACIDRGSVPHQGRQSTRRHSDPAALMMVDAVEMVARYAAKALPGSHAVPIKPCDRGSKCRSAAILRKSWKMAALRPMTKETASSARRPICNAHRAGARRDLARQAAHPGGSVIPPRPAKCAARPLSQEGARSPDRTGRSCAYRSQSARRRRAAVGCPERYARALRGQPA
jgi:hypothetical protein